MNVLSAFIASPIVVCWVLEYYQSVDAIDRWLNSFHNSFISMTQRRSTVVTTLPVDNIDRWLNEIYSICITVTHLKSILKTTMQLFKSIMRFLALKNLTSISFFYVFVSVIKVEVTRFYWPTTCPH